MLDADTEVHTVSASDLSTRVPIPEEETHETSNTITQAPPEDVIAEQSPTFSLLDVSATENLDTLPSEQPESILSCDELEDESNSARSLDASDSAQSTALAQSLTVDEAAEAQLRKWTIISKRKLAKNAALIQQQVYPSINWRQRSNPCSRGWQKQVCSKKRHRCCYGYQWR